jgi:hypothetical protein
MRQHAGLQRNMGPGDISSTKRILLLAELSRPSTLIYNLINFKNTLRNSIHVHLILYHPACFG